MREKRGQRGCRREKRDIRKCDVERIGGIEREENGNKRRAPDIPREEKEDAEQNYNNKKERKFFDKFEN